MSLPLWAILINVGIAAAALLAIAFTLSIRMIHEMQVQDLKLEAHRLRAIYEERIDALRRGEVTLEAPGEIKHSRAA